MALLSYDPRDASFLTSDSIDHRSRTISWGAPARPPPTWRSRSSGWVPIRCSCRSRRPAGGGCSARGARFGVGLWAMAASRRGCCAPHARGGQLTDLGDGGAGRRRIGRLHGRLPVRWLNVEGRARRDRADGPGGDDGDAHLDPRDPWAFGRVVAMLFSAAASPGHDGARRAARKSCAARSSEARAEGEGKGGRRSRRGQAGRRAGAQSHRAAGSPGARRGGRRRRRWIAAPSGQPRRRAGRSRHGAQSDGARPAGAAGAKAPARAEEAAAAGPASQPVRAAAPLAAADAARLHHGG